MKIKAKMAGVAMLGVAAAALGACGSSEGGGEAATEMNMCNFAGKLGEVIADVASGFEEEHNVKINWCTGTGSGSDNVAKIEAAKDNQIYDATVVDIQSQNLASSRGLWEKLDHGVVNTDDVYEPLLAPNDDSVPIGMITNDLYWNKDIFEENGWDAPTSATDILDPKYCNQVGILDVNQSYGIYTVLALGGLTKAQAEAGDIEDAFQTGVDKLVGIKDCLPTIEVSSGGLEQKMQSGEYAIGMHGSIRALPIIKAGVNLGAIVPEEGPFLTLSFLAPVKNGPNPELAQEFCDWFLTPEAQTQLMNEIFYGPVVSTVDVPEDLAELGVVTAEQIDDLIIPDVDAVTAARPDWTDQYFRDLG